jgi:hypothetical protein
VVFEGFVTVDENEGDFVGELAAQFVVAFDVDFAPGETTAALQLGESFLHDFAEMAALARVNNDLSQRFHGRSLAAFIWPEKHLEGMWTLGFL